MNFTTKLIRGDEAHRYRIEPEFISQWKMLAERTTHVSVFQEPEFVNPWYDIYKLRFEPLMVLGLSESQKVIGLIPLAIEFQSGRLCHAGAQHAEYSGWICDPSIDEEFVLAALSAIRKQISFSSWRWQYTPPRANISWLLARHTERIGVHTLFDTLNSPLLDLHQEDKLRKILKNKSVKSKINRLKRKGELKIERITSKDRVAQLLDQIEVLVNFRHEAAHRDAAFEGDSTQKGFYLERGNYLEDNHFSVLWLGDKLLAFNFGVIDHDTVYIGLTAFDPTESKHSPGVIFLIYLANLLKEEGTRYIDFTPGGDEYKERFSNKHYTLYRPTFYSRKPHRLFDQLKGITTRTLSRSLHKLGIDPWEQRGASRPSADQGSNYDLYSLNYKDYLEKTLHNQPQVSVQSFQDLLLFNEARSKVKRYEVLSDATKRFSREETVFTLTNNDDLLAYAWLGKPGAKYRNHGITFTPDKQDIVLDCLDLNQQLLDEISFTTLTGAMLKQAFSQKINCAHIFIPKSTDNEHAKRVLSEMGFKAVENNHSQTKNA